MIFVAPVRHVPVTNGAPVPILDWIGKSASTRHHRDVPYRLMEDDPALSVPTGSASDDNPAAGDSDNLLALKALLPRYAGRVKLIYISIDDNDGANLRLLMDEIFGAQRFVATMAWHPNDGVRIPTESNVRDCDTFRKSRDSS